MENAENIIIEKVLKNLSEKVRAEFGAFNQMIEAQHGSMALIRKCIPLIRDDEIKNQCLQVVDSMIETEDIMSRLVGANLDAMDNQIALISAFLTKLFERKVSGSLGPE